MRGFAAKCTNDSHNMGIVIVTIDVADADSSARVGIDTDLISQIDAGC